MAMGSELSLTPLIDAAVRRRCQVFLPVIPKRGRIMRFSSMTRGDGHWQKNRYGIDEYVARRTVAARQMDVVLLPLVAFDRQGRRLGQGGGYYDATFAFRMRRQHWKRPRLIGVAFSCQRVGQVPTDPHDVMLDAVVTEAGWADCRITRPGS
jgi:5-formyltetrahydrofolate cyclo-ligase